MPKFGRDEGEQKRRDRLAKLAKGPGVFVYDGKGTESEFIPTVLLRGGREAVFGADGTPALDDSGRQVYERKGSVVRDDKGQPVLGGVPKRVDHKIEVRNVRGIDFPAGKPVEVTDPSLALKLRGMDHFKEVEPIQVEEEPDAAPESTKRKPGRPPKVKVDQAG